VTTPIVNNTGPYQNVLMLGGADNYTWLPPKNRDRAQAYEKYDQIYWNDYNQYPIRYLVGEFPVYIPNPRTLVDTTAHYYLKGLAVNVKEPEKNKDTAEALKQFLRREMFLSRFHTSKHAGVTRGDYCFHMTADPDKPEGRRISLNAVHPGKVILDEDPDNCDRIIRVHLVERIPHPDKEGEWAVKELCYWYDDGDSDADDRDPDVPMPDQVVREDPQDRREGSTRVVMREERIWSLNKPWWDKEERELLATTLPAEALPEEIDTIPVYWFPNLSWDNSPYGYSEFRGFERTFQSISQVTTDQGTSLSLEGLGVYATDGGKPVDNKGSEQEWEIGPGKVMEVPNGAYFRRVEGVGSVRPNIDHIDYLESKIREAGGLSDVALGRVDVQTASSGIALAIKFMPTLAKLDERDKVGIDRLTQLFYDWLKWYEAYEGSKLGGEIEVTIGDKLPTDRTGRINELNNMLDRGVISREYYRAEMQKLGYEFPDDIEDQIDAEKQKEAEQKAAMAPPGLQQNAIDASTGDMPPPPGNQPGQVTQKKQVFNNSNNKAKPNESGGTEADQKVGKQARGGRPIVNKRVPTAAK
jgi:hypothetical protein